MNRLLYFLMCLLWACNTNPSLCIENVTWSTENLASAYYANGETIRFIDNVEEWENCTEAAYTYYNFDKSMAETYGYLYNWYAVNNAKNICPKGWHVATQQEWQQLISHYGGKNTAAYKLKAPLAWQNQHKPLKKTNKFNALPGGNCKENGTFNGLGLSGAYWSAFEVSDSQALAFFMNSAHTKVGNAVGHKQNGLSCRCVKDYDQR